MRVPAEWTNDEAGLVFVDPKHDEQAPLAARGAVFALNGGQLPDLVMARALFEGETTEWRVAWIAGPLIGFASMRGDHKRWSADSEVHKQVQTVVDVTSWVRTLESIQAVSLPHVEARWHWHRDNESSVEWGVEASLGFTDGEQLNLPLVPGSAQDDAQVIQAFISAATAAMANSPVPGRGGDHAAEPLPD